MHRIEWSSKFEVNTYLIVRDLTFQKDEIALHKFELFCLFLYRGTIFLNILNCQNICNYIYLNNLLLICLVYTI